MGIIYCGPFAAEINQGTRYGHEGYAGQILADGTESEGWVREFREYRAGCDCGWRSVRVHSPTDEGETAAKDEWNDEHLQPLIRAVAARRVVPAVAVLGLLAELRAALDGLPARGPDGELTARGHGRCDVIETLEARLDDIAIEAADLEQPEGSRRVGGAW